MASLSPVAQPVEQTTQPGVSRILAGRDRRKLPLRSDALGKIDERQNLGLQRAAAG